MRKAIRFRSSAGGLIELFHQILTSGLLLLTETILDFRFWSHGLGLSEMLAKITRYKPRTNGMEKKNVWRLHSSDIQGVFIFKRVRIYPRGLIHGSMAPEFRRFAP